MTALIPLLAFAAIASDQPRLDLARAQDVAAAVQSCSRAVTGRTKVDHARLEGEGWRQDTAKGIWIVRRKPGNAAIVTASNGRSSAFPGNIAQDACLVRARVGDRAVLKTIADEMSRTLGFNPYVSKRKQDTWTWFGPATLIAIEPFDDAPDGTPVTQVVVAPIPQWLQRPTPDASSQNQNQEPR